MAHGTFDPNFPQPLIINADWPETDIREWLAPPFEFPAELEREITFLPGHALRNLRGPGPSNNYGIRSMELHFYVKGEKGVTQFTLSLGWVPEMVKKPGYSTINELRFTEPMAFDLGYHARVPQWEGQEDYGRSDCKLTPNGMCFYDGSGLQAEAMFNQFVMTGDVNVVWKTLVEKYNDLIYLPEQTKELEA